MVNCATSNDCERSQDVFVAQLTFDRTIVEMETRGRRPRSVGERRRNQRTVISCRGVQNGILPKMRRATCQWEKERRAESALFEWASRRTCQIAFGDRNPVAALCESGSGRGRAITSCDHLGGGRQAPPCQTSPFLHARLRGHIYLNIMRFVNAVGCKTL